MSIIKVKEISLYCCKTLQNVNLAEATQYTVTTYTSYENGAGTGSDFYLSIIGSKGNTSEHVANNWGNDRVRGGIDVYTFSDSADIGEFQCVFIKMEGDDGWLIKQVCLQI